MIKNQNSGKGIPISISLSQTLEAENIDSRRSTNNKRILKIACLSVAIAILVSFIAKALICLINLITNISFNGHFSFAPSSPQQNHLGFFVIFVPSIGGVVVGLIALYGSKAIRGHGIPEAMEQILTNDSKIKPAIAYLKPISSAIAIGTGGPFGAEGPIIATGGALGSTIGQLLKISHYERKILLAAGATAGMSAIFGSPIAGIFLAIELLLFELSPDSIIPVAFACITGAAGHHFLFESGPVFPVGHLIPMASNQALVIYSLFGFLIGLLAVGVTKIVYYLEDLFEKLPVHWMWWPAIGGLFVGIIGYFNSRTLGVGYNNIIDVLSGSLPMRMVLMLCVLKFLSWAIALASGTSGGTLAPLLTIGGATGALMGMVVQQIFPGIAISISLAALVGMSAMFAGASRALLTSIIFALESTGQANALLPLLVSCTIAYFVSLYLMKNTIMTEKIARRGIKTPENYKPDILEQFTVKDVINSDGLIVSEDNTIDEVKLWLKENPLTISNYLMLVNNDGKYFGMVRTNNLFNKQTNTISAIGMLAKHKLLYIRLEDSLKIVVEKMVNENLDILPVVREDQSVIGVIGYADIFNVYKISMEKYIKSNPHISIKRQALKLLVKGQKLSPFPRK